jgi:hypothetical protein
VLLVDGRGIAADPPRATALWAAACERGYARACSTLALEHQLGAHVAKDGPKALALYTRACDLGELGGCSHAATSLDEGIGVTPDEAKARVFLQKACDGGSKSDCGRLRDMDDRVSPREIAVYRVFHVSHREARIDKKDRSPEEAKKLAVAAVAALDRGGAFDAIANKYDGTDRIAAIGRAPRTSFRLKPSTEVPQPELTTRRPQPEFSVKPGKATYLPNPSFGFIVVYRVR